MREVSLREGLWAVAVAVAVVVEELIVVAGQHSAGPNMGWSRLGFARAHVITRLQRVRVVLALALAFTIVGTTA